MWIWVCTVCGTQTEVPQKQCALCAGELGKTHSNPNSHQSFGCFFHYALGTWRIPAILLQSGGPANNSSSEGERREVWR